MSFWRHAEIYPSDGGQTLGAQPPAHRLDEFPAGYSSAGCSPAEPASASPATSNMRYVVIADNGLSANGNLSLISVSHGRGAAQTSIPDFCERVRQSMHTPVLSENLPWERRHHQSFCASAPTPQLSNPFALTNTS